MTDEERALLLTMARVLRNQISPNSRKPGDIEDRRSLDDAIYNVAWSQRERMLNARGAPRLEEGSFTKP